MQSQCLVSMRNIWGGTFTNHSSHTFEKKRQCCQVLIKHTIYKEKKRSSHLIQINKCHFHAGNTTSMPHAMLKQLDSLIGTLKALKRSLLCGHKHLLYLSHSCSYSCHGTIQNLNRGWWTGTYLQIFEACHTPRTCQAVGGSGRCTYGTATTSAAAGRCKCYCRSSLYLLPLQRALHGLVKE